MPFAEKQIRQLGGKLLERHVRTREERGITLSYIEGWHAITEANRIFGFDGWDRETLATECVWQDARSALKACAYTARVRIRVRAGETVAYRDGSGVGHGTAATMGEAHESALKEAETDATKRALTTFGNLFGLALYDKKQTGMRRTPRRRRAKEDPATNSWVLYGSGGAPLSTHDDPRAFCLALKDAIRGATAEVTLSEIWERNSSLLENLRGAMPALTTAKGHHYADLLAQYYERQRHQFKAASAAQGTEEVSVPDSSSAQAIPETIVDKSELTIGVPKRIRDEDHLRFVASQACLICGRKPAHAHHLRFAQPRSMGSKVSDEWTVPLCFLHHRALHDVGSEEAWWSEKGIDPKHEATKLWEEVHQPNVENPRLARP